MMTPNPHTDSLHDELEARLNASDAERASGAFRVEKVLKRSDAEETQLVYLRLCDGRELGPYVRKLIDARSGLGGAYPRLVEAQRDGVRFRQLPRIVSCDERDGGLEVVMEHVRGATLREVVEHAGELAEGPSRDENGGGGDGGREDGPGKPAASKGPRGGHMPTRGNVRLDIAERLMPAVCDAVLELHQCPGGPLVHRDLTPSNVIVPAGDAARPVLIDLGIARAWKDGARCDTTHFGTRAYAPPEQFGFGQTDARTDVYALGMLAFFCLTGRDPEPGDREGGFCSPEVPEHWREIIRTATALDPQERFSGVAELRAAMLRGQDADEAGDAARRAAGDVLPATSRHAAGTATAGAADGAGSASGRAAVDVEKVAPGTAKTDPAAPASPAAVGDVAARTASLLAGGTRLSAARLAGLSPLHRGKRPARLFTVWNSLVMASALLCCAISASLAFNEEAMPGSPPVFRAFGYVVWMPCGLLLACYLLMGKRWLRENVAFFRDRTAAQVWRALLIAYAAVTAVWLALNGV